MLRREGLPSQCGYTDCLGEYPAPRKEYPSSIWWNDDNMRRHTEAEASVLFGKSRSPFSPSTPAPLSKGGVLYGPEYLDEVRWKLYQGEEDRRTKTTQTRPLAGMSNEQSIELMRIFHHKSYITDHRSMTPTIYGVWSGTTYDRIQQDRRKCKNVIYQM